MGRLLPVLGILLVIGGIIATATSMFSNVLSGSLQGVQNVVNTAVNADEAAAKYCKEGEKLVTEKGASDYTPGQGYASSVVYYCEDSEGQRRDVTVDFANDLVGQAFNAIPSFNFTPHLELLLISGLGVVLIVVGAIVGRRQRAGIMLMPVQVGDNMDMAQVIQQAQAVKSQQIGNADNARTAKLRQLDEARDKGLISKEEYDRLRQQILESFK